MQSFFDMGKGEYQIMANLTKYEMEKHSLFIFLSVEKYGKRNCQSKYWDYYNAYKQIKPKKKEKRG